MLRVSTPSFSPYAFLSTPSPLVVKQDAMKPVPSPPPLMKPALQRQGRGYDTWIPKTLSNNAKSLLVKTLEWAEVNGVAITQAQVTALADSFESALNVGQTQVMNDIQTHLQLDSTHPHYNSLKGNLSTKIKGGEQIKGLVKWLLTLEYVPSSIMMLFVTNRIYNEMQARQSITPEQKKVLMRQEIARQGVGAGLHVARTLIGFETVVWVMNLMKRHPNVRQAGEQLMKHPSPLQKKLGKSLQCMAHYMQKTWNTLYGDGNQTVASIASLMLINILTYGITRPLMVNMAFFGLHTTEEGLELEKKSTNKP
jgi:hypothetical protein